jgi:hypothetical protein
VARISSLDAGKDPAFVQLVLEKAIAKSLEALSRPEIY